MSNRYNCYYNVNELQVLISLTDKETAEVPLIVRRPPIISDNSTRSVVVVEGQDVELKCFASGYPPPEVFIYFTKIYLFCSKVFLGHINVYLKMIF